MTLSLPVPVESYDSDRFAVVAAVAPLLASAAVLEVEGRGGVSLLSVRDDECETGEI